MGFAVKVAKEKGARMLVLETQSCNVAAIAFYLKQGFVLIGFDSAAYSNTDLEKKEVRIEMGLTL
jgi:ribosomal protein S18 acetylase RimI-like enzyme